MDELVRRIMDAINARDFDALAEIPFDDEFEFHSHIAEAEGGSYRGFDGLRQWARNVDEIWEAFHPRVEEVRQLDEERALVMMRVTGTARASGVPLDWHMGQIWTWRDGALRHIAAFADQQEALEAAGL